MTEILSQLLRKNFEKKIQAQNSWIFFSCEESESI